MLEEFKNHIEEYRDYLLQCLDFLPRYSSDGPKELDPGFSVFASFAKKRGPYGRIDEIARWAQNKWSKQWEETKTKLRIVLGELDNLTERLGLPRYRYRVEQTPIQSIEDTIEYLEPFLVYTNYVDRCRDKAGHRDVVLEDLMQQEREYMNRYAAQIGEKTTKTTLQSQAEKGGKVAKIYTIIEKVERVLKVVLRSEKAVGLVMRIIRFLLSWWFG